MEHIVPYSIYQRSSLCSKSVRTLKEEILCYAYDSLLTLFGQYCPHLKILDINYFQL